MYSSGTSSGTYSQKLTQEKLEVEITVEGGNLELALLRVPFLGAKTKVVAPVRATATVKQGEATIRFATPVNVKKGDTLRVSC
jgi:hypothetical protein